MATLETGELPHVDWVALFDAAVATADAMDAAEKVAWAQRIAAEKAAAQAKRDQAAATIRAAIPSTRPDTATLFNDTAAAPEVNP